MIFAASLSLGPVPAASADEHVFTSDATIADGDTTWDGYDIIVRGSTVTINGAHSFNSLTIERNGDNQPGIVTHTPGFADGLFLTIAESFYLQGSGEGLTASRIDVDGCGYGPETGPGAGRYDSHSSASGGGHGGDSGRSYYVDGGSAYGSIMFPTELGSGGGTGWVAGGAGGGAIGLTVGGMLQWDGLISANGGDGSVYGGGGSGGSVYLQAEVLTGSGSVTAHGGQGEGNSGGGGGGRIALYTPCDQAFFDGNVHVGGGAGYENGFAGTIYSTVPGRRRFHRRWFRGPRGLAHLRAGPARVR